MFGLQTMLFYMKCVVKPLAQIAEHLKVQTAVFVI